MAIRKKGFGQRPKVDLFNKKELFLLTCVPRDVPELLRDGLSRSSHVPLHEDLVFSLQLFEYEGTHNAVADDETQETDVRKEVMLTLRDRYLVAVVGCVSTR